MGGVELPPAATSAPSIDPRFSSLTMEQRLALANAADAAVADQMAALRADLDVITTNAPVAIQNTGTYTGGPLPEQDDFIKAYGVDNGPEKYRTFQAQVETAKSVHAMQTMPADEIQSMLKASEAAIGSGDTAALGAAKHASLAAAAEQTLKARDADPAGYVAKAFHERRRRNGLPPRGRRRTSGPKPTGRRLPHRSPRSSSWASSTRTSSR